MTTLNSEIAVFISGASKFLRKQSYAALDEHVLALRSAAWSELSELGSKLVDPLSVLCRAYGSENRSLFLLLGRLVQILKATVTEVDTFQSVLGGVQVQTRSIAAHSPCLLSVGSGGPGRLGCANATGSQIVWNPILDINCGVVAAMDALSLDLVALPGARLPSHAKLPKLGSHCLCCRGGPAYGSTAWLWRAELDHAITVRHDIGSDRRLWIALSCGNGDVFHLCCVYLPPYEVYGSNEESWHRELSGLESDLESLFNSACASRVLLIGDWNGQPPSLSGRGDLNAARGRALDRFSQKWSLALLNPRLQMDQVVNVSLPLRHQVVQLHPGTTWYNVNSKGRAIDLAFCSDTLLGDATVHNGVDCKSSGECVWNNCVEYCCGDHFLQQVSLWLPYAPHNQQARPLLPQSWHRRDRWNSGFANAREALQERL